MTPICLTFYIINNSETTQCTAGWMWLKKLTIKKTFAKFWLFTFYRRISCHPSNRSFHGLFLLHSRQHWSFFDASHQKSSLQQSFIFHLPIRLKFCSLFNYLFTIFNESNWKLFNILSLNHHLKKLVLSLPFIIPQY